MNLEIFLQFILSLKQQSHPQENPQKNPLILDSNKQKLKLDSPKLRNENTVETIDMKNIRMYNSGKSYVNIQK